MTHRALCEISEPAVGRGAGNDPESAAPPDLAGVRQSVTSRVFHSWLSMKTGVMAWLWYLNVLYWIAFFQLDRPEAFWAAISYLAVAPILLGMVSWQRGLTRLTGLIHLPWVPLTVYLGLRLLTDVLGPAASMADGAFYFLWLHAVFWSTLICVGFDAIDVIRWLSGERHVFGSPAAYAAGASKLARGGTLPARREPAS